MGAEMQTGVGPGAFCPEPEPKCVLETGAEVEAVLNFSRLRCRFPIASENVHIW